MGFLVSRWQPIVSRTVVPKEGAVKMYKHQIRSLVVPRIFAVAILATLSGVFPSRNLAEDRSGAVYTISNQSTGNSVVVFHRAQNGTLSLAGSFPPAAPVQVQERIRWRLREQWCWTGAIGCFLL